MVCIPNQQRAFGRGWEETGLHIQQQPVASAPVALMVNPALSLYLSGSGSDL